MRLLVTGGISEDGVFPLGRAELAVLVTELGERDWQRFELGVKLITSVIQIDDQVIGDGKVGSRTYELEQRFVRMVENG